LVGAAGVSSEARPSGGIPYTAAVDENTKWATPARTQASTRLREAQVLAA